MNKSKLRKSMIKTNQNSYEVYQHLQYFPLLLVKKQSLQLSEKALEIIEDQASGKIFLIAFYSKNSKLINAIYRNNTIPSKQQQYSGVWVTNYPRYKDQKDVKFLYLQVNCKDSQSAILLHNFCSLICSTIIVDLDEIHTFDFLASVENTIIFDHHEHDPNTIRKQRRKELASLVFLKKSKGKQTNNQIRKNSKELDEIISNPTTVQLLSSLYQQVGFLKHSADLVQNMPSGELNQIQNQINKLCISNSKNDELLCGPIMKQYIQVIVNSLRYSSKIDIKQTTASIKISEGYNAYLQSLSYYDLNIRKELKQSGCPNLKQKLKLIREDTILQYKKLSNDAFFLIRLHEYLDQTQERLQAQNNKIYDLANLTYLKQFSNDLITKVQAGRITIPQAEANIEKMTQQYKNTALGDNRFQILTASLNLLHKAVSKSAPKEDNSKLLRQLQNTNLQNSRLLKKVDELEEFRRKQTSSKCCEIM